MIAPILKWAGGKRKLASTILEHIRPYYRARLQEKHLVLSEPFVGGGAVSLAALDAGFVQPRSLFWNDLNPDLVTTYNALRTTFGLSKIIEHDLARPSAWHDPVVERVIAMLKSWGTTEADYLRIRAENAPMDPKIVACGPATLAYLAARMIYLNKVGFNGLYRVNKAGKFNVPYGGENRNALDAEGLRAFADLVAKMEATTCLDFAEAFEKHRCVEDLRRKTRDYRARDHFHVFYCDPPYLPLSKTSSFASYTSGGFGIEEHERLANVGLAAARDGALVLISSSDTLEARCIYKDYTLHELQVQRNISAKSKGRGKVGELLCVAAPQ